MDTARTTARNFALIGLTASAAILLPIQPCAAVDIRAQVMPVRIIYVDHKDNIVAITSNTKQSVTPSVRRNDPPHAAVPYTASIKAQYQQALKRYDFSRPVEIHIKKLSPWERFVIFLMNPVVSLG